MDTAGVVRLVCLSQADLSSGESAYHGILRRAAGMSVDRVGIALVKGFRGMARRADELAELYDQDQRIGLLRK